MGGLDMMKAKEKRLVLAEAGAGGERNICEAVLDGGKVVLQAGQVEALFDWAAENLAGRLGYGGGEGPFGGGVEIEVVGAEGDDAPEGLSEKGEPFRIGEPGCTAGQLQGKREITAGRRAAVPTSCRKGLEFDEVVVEVEGEDTDTQNA